MYDIVIFDLDGTISDPEEGIGNSYLYALNRMNIDVPGPETLRTYIGPPLRDVFSSKFGLSQTDVKKAVDLWREYFSDKGMYENNPYDGMEQLLTSLKKNGCKLGVATVKPQIYVEKILKHFEFDVYFASVVGSLLNGERSDKETLIGNALEACGHGDRDRAVMVGDRILDIDGARACGIDSIGVLYGFGSREEIESANPTKIVSSVEELSEILVRK